MKSFHLIHILVNLTVGFLFINPPTPKHTHTHTHTLTHTLTHTHPLTHTHTLTHSLTHPHTQTLTHSHTLTHSLTHTLTHTHPHTLNHSPTPSQSPSHSPSHTHSHRQICYSKLKINDVCSHFGVALWKRLILLPCQQPSEALCTARSYSFFYTVSWIQFT